MEFGLGSYGLGYLAGLVSTLSPCVLPLLPILFASALAQHRLGPLALAAGVAISFTVAGIAVAGLGSWLIVDAADLRRGAALLMAGLGVLLLSDRLRQGFASATAGVAAAGQNMLNRVGGSGLIGQFAVGLLLGLVWTPCVGPTLGAASGLAAQGRDLGQVALLMSVFGIGAATPLALIGGASRGIAARTRLMRFGRVGQRLLGVVLIAIGLGVVAGVDRGFEAWVLDHSPAWLIALTTRY